MPHIIKTNINLENVIDNFKIKGFVISHISQLEQVSKYNLNLIANFNLNIYNNYSVQKLKEFNFIEYTISSELNKFEINELLHLSSLSSELIVYGKIPVMTNNYCYLRKI